MYVLLVLSLYVAGGWYVVFMQAVVSGSSVRVVRLCDAGGGQLGPARCHGCAGAALSAQW